MTTTPQEKLRHFIITPRDEETVTAVETSTKEIRYLRRDKITASALKTMDTHGKGWCRVKI